MVRATWSSALCAARRSAVASGPKAAGFGGSFRRPPYRRTWSTSRQMRCTKRRGAVDADVGVDDVALGRAVGEHEPAGDVGAVAR